VELEVGLQSELRGLREREQGDLESELRRHLTLLVERMEVVVVDEEEQREAMLERRVEKKEHEEDDRFRLQIRSGRLNLWYGEWIG